MASIVAHPLALNSPTMTRSPDTIMTEMHESPTQRKKKSEGEDRPRGRRRSRPQNKANDTNENTSEGGENGNADDGHSSGPDGPSRKRRRSRKGLDKKHECTQAGCTKSYSRAEHLYRHQLNHTPKQIYECDYPDCERTFVRLDLCNRHKERHTSKGSQLQRKDSMLSNVSPATDGIKPISMHGSMSPETARPAPNSRPRPTQLQYPSPPENVSSPFSPSTAQSTATFPGSGSSSTVTDFTYQQPGSSVRRSNSDHNLPPGQGPLARPPLLNSNRNQRSSFGVADAKPADPTFSRPALQPANMSYGYLSSTSNNQSFQGSKSIQPAMHPPYVTQQNLTPFSLPPSGFSAPVASSPREMEPSYSISSPHTTLPLEYQQRGPGLGQQAGPDIMLLDQITASSMPVFGGEGYNRSPFAIPDDFVAYLFSEQQYSTSSPLGQSGVPQGYANYFDNQNQFQHHYPNDSSIFYQHNNQQQMAITSLLDPSLPETVISEDKSQEIVDLIKERFTETDHAPVRKKKDGLLEGDRSSDSHILSRKMMQVYIASFWSHFHSQLPILHKPTFSPDKTPNLLLIAMIAIGASCLDKGHGHSLTTHAAELSNFLAWHLRWEIFSDEHFRPPAKLWVFQALLLLEVYEKLYSTRALHERAHIHHATTITLMRRGSSLIGRSAADSPPNPKDDRPGLNGSRHSSTSGGANTPDEWWTHWVTNEATRRAAFAAFMIDSTHATMFGHSTVMVAHEMRLPLPCDEALWSAASSAEVGKVEANLHASGVKPVSFLEGLKRTLNGQQVQTNAFGRSILMAGLLSVSWHMNQRDLQVNSLGVSQALGGRDKWRSSLTKSFDVWVADFNRSLEDGSEGPQGPYNFSGRQDENVVFESRTVLHHLAHMAMHVDIVDCQIYARAKRLLGRTIGPQDLNSAQRRMRDLWAPSAKARDATYYALRFLCTVLLPEDSSPHGFSHDAFEYSARDDVLMNRSWVLYFAALIVWCYGYALEGQIIAQHPVVLTTPEDEFRDMQAYLRKLKPGAQSSPEDLKFQKGFNGCTGMLMVLRRTFESTRWELLHEAAALLDNCIRLLGGS